MKKLNLYEGTDDANAFSTNDATSILNNSYTPDFKFTPDPPVIDGE